MNTSWPLRLCYLLFFAGIATILLLPLASNTSVPCAVDYLNHLSMIIQAKLAVADSQFPLRLAPTDHAGWPYPIFQFYSPSSYTLAGLTHLWLSPANPFLAYKFTVWCAMIIGGIYMQRLAFWLVKSSSAALLASVIYLTAPYTIIIIDHIGAFNETIAVGVLPVVLYYTVQYYYHPTKLVTLLQAALAWYFLATLHLLTFICSSFFVFALLLLLTINHLPYWKNLILASITYVFGCLLAMWYLAPVVVFSGYLVANLTFGNVDSFNAYTPSFFNLISPFANITAVSGDNNDSIALTHPAVGWPILIGVILCTYLLLRDKHLSKNNRHWITSLLTLFVIGFVLIWAPVNMWQWLPKPLLVIQYSWRLLAQIMWIGALLFALAIDRLFKQTLNLRRTILGLVFIVVCNFQWLITPEAQINDFPDKLKFLSSADFYLINGQTHRQFVSAIDNFLLDSSTFNDNLALNTLKSFAISRSLLNLAAAPFLSLQGNIPYSPSLNQQQFSVMADGSTIATYTLKPGPFHWNIPLSKKLTPTKNPSALFMQFKTKNINGSGKTYGRLTLPLDEISLKGFLKPDKILAVPQVQPHCYQQKDTTRCTIYAPSSVRLIELPTFYYPHMLSITSNGKPVPYLGVFYQNHLITTIVAQPGKVNNIAIQFRGLLWANFISSAAWQAGILIALFLVLRSIFYRKRV